MLQSITPQNAMTLIETGRGILIDVRETAEHTNSHIAGARLQPLSVIANLPVDPDTEKTAVFFCNTGNRTQANAELLNRRGFKTSYFLEGGLQNWKSAGFPVVTGSSGYSIARQVQMAVGLVVFLASVLSFQHSAFTWLALFVGMGFFFAGLTGHCLLAQVLTAMPWNKPKEAAACKR